MTKNNEDILNKIYSGTKKGELIKKKKQLESLTCTSTESHS